MISSAAASTAIASTACFLASFLAFSAELAVAKMLLPHFGASAMVWNASVLFFQGVLVAATAWTHWAQIRLGSERAFKGHLVLMALAALTLPITVSAPQEGTSFLLGLLFCLFASIAAPFFVLSTTTSMLQSRLPTSSGQDYSLYAASNAGALAALIVYPFFLEPRMTLADQQKLWYLGYALYGLLLLAELKYPGRLAGEEPRAALEPAAPPGRRLLWILLAAGPVMTLLAATSFLSYSLGAAPLLWALPLAVYLSTLVLNFKSRPADSKRLYWGLLILLALCLAPGLIRVLPESWISTRQAELFMPLVILSGLAVNLLGLFVVCMIAHRSLARSRPQADASGFYFFVALGGWLGSLANTLLPSLARHNARLSLEWLVAVSVSTAAILWRDWARLAELWGSAGTALRAAVSAIFLAALAAVSVMVRGVPRDTGIVKSLRSYYGIYRVKEAETLRVFLHGNTIHGLQYTDKYMKRYPLGYYHPHSPLGDVFEKLGARFDRVAAVGLGIGSAAAYGKSGQRFDFYELDGDVEKIARLNFTHLRDSPAQIRVILGDARVSLAGSAETYDLLFLDAFSSDAVPIHLLTREAFELYLRRLSPRGLIVIHVSSRMVELKPILAALAADLGLAGAAKSSSGPDAVEDEFSARYAALSRDPSLIHKLTANLGWNPLSDHATSARVWTDQRSSLLDVLGH